MLKRNVASALFQELSKTELKNPLNGKAFNAWEIMSLDTHPLRDPIAMVLGRKTKPSLEIKLAYDGKKIRGQTSRTLLAPGYFMSQLCARRLVPEHQNLSKKA